MCIQCKQVEQRASYLNHCIVRYLQYILFYYKVKQGFLTFGQNIGQILKILVIASRKRSSCGVAISN